MKDIAVFLFDLTGNMAKPWLDAGYECWIVDIQHPPAYKAGGITSDGRLHKVHADLSRPWLPPFDRDRIAFVAAWPPCDHVAVSGSGWMKGKGLRKLETSIAMFATASEFCEWSGAPYIIENPVSTISTYWRKSDYRFNPWHYSGLDADNNYTKTTCLWIGGGFVMPEPNVHPKVEAAVDHVIKSCGKMVPIKKALSKCDDVDLVEQWYPDDRIHKCAPGADRHNIRSATPMGFAQAVFNTNGRLLAPQKLEATA